MVRIATLSFCAGALALAGAAKAGDVTRITGKVIFKGDADKYKRTVIDTSKDPNCKKSKAKIDTDTVIIDTKSDPPTLRDVLVSIDDEFAKEAFPVPAEPVTLTQVGCHYEPHVLGLMEGQTLKVLNGDDTSHNIHFLPKVNEEHNFTQPKKDLESGKDLKFVAEEPFKVKCDVHPWMECYIGVFKHPFFDVTDNEGVFELKGMPAGKYTVKAWHSEFGEQKMDVEVTTGETKTLDFTFESSG